MPVTPRSTLGSVQDTANTTTVTYTLTTGQSVSVGDYLVGFVGAAGNASCVASSVADSQSNTYSVAKTEAPNGSVQGSIVYAKVTTGLSAGDTITVTLGLASTDKRVVWRVWHGAASSTPLDIAISASNTSSTAPASGTSGATAQADEEGACLVVWNGNTTLTPDAAWTVADAQTHFDNSGASQTKQMAVYEQTLSATGTQSFTGSLGASQPWAVLLITFKAAASSPPSVKDPPRGLSTRDLDTVPSGYEGAYSNRMHDIHRNVIQPNDPTITSTVTAGDTVIHVSNAGAYTATRHVILGTVNAEALVVQSVNTGGGTITLTAPCAHNHATGENVSTLAGTEVTRLVNLLNADQAAGDTGTFRFFKARYEPGWVKTKVGTFKHADPGSGNNPASAPVDVAKFWVTAYQTDWDRLQWLMALEFDNHAALRGVHMAMCEMYYPETLQRHTTSEADRAELVGGGTGWTGADANGNGGQNIPVPGAGFSFAADVQSQKKAIDIHAARWAKTRMIVAFTPWQILYSQQEAGYTYSNGNQKHLGSDDNTLSNTKMLIDYMVSVLGPTDRVILGNQSVRSSYFDSSGALITGTSFGIMYSYFLTKPFPKYYQTATLANVGNFNATMSGIVNDLLGNACEPTNYSGTSSPYDITNLTKWNNALLGVALPGGGATTYAPLNTALPAISINAGTGYTPGTVLGTTMGSWDGGPDGVDHYYISWYRKDPVSGTRTLVQGPTTHTNGADVETYTIQVADELDTIEVDAHADNVDGTSATVTSADTPVIQSPSAPAPKNLTKPAASPTAPVKGQTITWTAGTWTNTPDPSLTTWEIQSKPSSTWGTVQGPGTSPSWDTSGDTAGTAYRAIVVVSNGTPSTPVTSAATSPLGSAAAVSLTATVDDPNGRVILLVNSTVGATVEITRTHPSGTVVDVRGMTAATLSGGVFLGWDWEAPIGIPVTYQATAKDGGGSTVGTSDPVQVEWDASALAWLKDPLAPARNMPIMLDQGGLDNITYVTPAGVFPVIGRPAPITIGQIRQAAQGDLLFQTRTLGEAGELHLLTASGRVLLLQTSPELEVGSMYFQPLTATETRPSPIATSPLRRWDIGFAETDSPIGSPGAFATYQTLLNNYATYQAAFDVGATYLILIETVDGLEIHPELQWRGD